jgi:hypothetical protein
MLTSVVTFYDNETGPSSTASLLYPPPSSAVSNRKSGIRNPNNRRIFKRLHFSNRKYSAIFSAPSASNFQSLLSNQDTAIKTPDKPRHFNHFQFSNRDKTQVLHPEHGSGSACFSASLPPRFSLSESLCLRASVANLCDNGWLKLRLM